MSQKGQKILGLLNVCSIILRACCVVHVQEVSRQQFGARMHNNLLTRQGSDQLGPAKATLLLLYNHFIVLYHWGVTVETIVKKLQLPNQCLILCTLGNSASDPRLPSATNFWPMIIKNSSSRFLCISLVPKWIRFNTEWLALSKSRYILGLKALTWDAF